MKNNILGTTDICSALPLKLEPLFSLNSYQFPTLKMDAFMCCSVLVNQLLTFKNSSTVLVSIEILWQVKISEGAFTVFFREYSG